MNLRQKFIWNIVLAISSIVLIWNSYYQFYEHIDIGNAYKRFNDEEVGTDKELQKMIVDLEENLSSRQNMKFRLKENPLELTKVIRLDGSNTAWRNSKSRWTWRFGQREARIRSKLSHTIWKSCVGHRCRTSQSRGST